MASLPRPVAHALHGKHEAAVVEPPWLHPVPPDIEARALVGYVVEREGWYFVNFNAKAGGSIWSRNPLRAFVSPYPLSNDATFEGGRHVRALLWQESVMLPLRYWPRVIEGRFSITEKDGIAWMELLDGPAFSLAFRLVHMPA